MFEHQLRVGHGIERQIIETDLIGKTKNGRQMMKMPRLDEGRTNVRKDVELVRIARDGESWMIIGYRLKDNP